jgi:hypothetical protein
MNIKQLIDFNTLSFARICEKIRNGEHFSLARYGDGEFNAILGTDGGENCDGHPYYPAMGRALGDILRSKPPYYIGLHQDRKIELETVNWLYQAGLIEEIEETDGSVSTAPLLQFVPNAVFHDAQVGKDNDGVRTIPKPGAINELWKALQGKKVWIIGPGYLEDQVAIEANNVTIPGKNTFEHIENILEVLTRFHDLTGAVVLVCASMCAPIIVDHLHRQYGNKGTFIDFGSTFDPFTPGAPFSRSFHQKIKA